MKNSTPFLAKFDGARTGLANLFWLVSFFFMLLMPVCFITGFPVPFLEGTAFKMKSLRKPFELFYIFFSLGVLFHPARGKIIDWIKTKLDRIADWRGAIWALTVIYFLLHLWTQVSRYLSLEINFVPFLFYDYMLWFFDQGKFCYTGFLHGYYHVNLVLLLLYPVWNVIQSQWILHVAQPLITSVAALPFYFWSRERLNNNLYALTAAFVYLNYRYLQNVLSVNFAVEIFYPLTIFSAVWFASKPVNLFYWTAVMAGLLTKEDSIIYFGGLGIAYLFSPAQRARGFWTVVLSLAYAVFVLKIFLPWSESTILKGDMHNYREIIADPLGFLLKPWIFIRELFIPLEKLETFFKLTSKLLFLPLFSSWFFLAVLAVYPLFFRAAGQFEMHAQFIELALYYSAPVLPFLFLAFVDGWKRALGSRFLQHQGLPGLILALLVFLNGFNFRPERFTQDDIRTISLAKTLPKDKVVVTQGHLLPYLGYRQWNFYFADPYQNNSYTKEAYSQPDYYFFDFEANSYPLSPEALREKAVALRNEGRYKVLVEDHRRLVLQRQS